MSQTSYILGHSGAEIQRLIHQAGILRPVTEHLLQRIGISQGMRVLDVGCGAGDVAMLAAELVGPSGRVIAVDRDPKVLAVAAGRAQSAGLQHIEFRDDWASVFADGTLFDIVIGRYVLIHQTDPAGLIRALARVARKGATIAFHEVSLQDGVWSTPPVPLLEAVSELITTAFQILPHHDAGDRVAEHFVNAGLSFPNLFCESPMGGGQDCPLCGWVCGVLRTLALRLAEMGVDVAERIGCLDSLESRLRDDIAATSGQVRGPAQICAWAKA